jgi:hypothetical protein
MAAKLTPVIGLTMIVMLRGDLRVERVDVVGFRAYSLSGEVCRRWCEY